MTRPPASPRVVVAHPDLPAPVEVGSGRVRLLDEHEAVPVVATVLGRDRRGTTYLDGRRLRPGGLGGRVRRGLGVVSGAPVGAEVSVHDHLAAILGHRGAVHVLAGAPLLAGRGGDPAGVLSGGERRVLAWLRARAVDPRAVLLDRAAEGLDAATLAWARDVVAGWTADGVAVLVRAGRGEERAWTALGRAHTSPAD